MDEKKDKPKRHLRLVEGLSAETSPEKTLSQDDKNLLDQLDHYAKLFTLKKSQDPSDDFSKHFIIFSYNYFELGLHGKAREMLMKVEPDYFNLHFLRDMEVSVEHRNLAEDLEKDGQMDRAREHRIEAEFFIVAARILPFLDRDPWMKEQLYYQEFIRQLQKKSFLLKVLPNLKEKA